MKIILAPTDFSAASAHAVDYAAALCGQLQAKLMLFHAYMMPVTVSEVPYVMFSGDELQKTNAETIAKEAERVRTAAGIEVETLVRMGLPLAEIKDLEDEKEIDLVVMAVKASDAMEKLVGSTTNAVIRDFRKPVLVIPEEATFNGYRSITYAADFDFQTNLECLEPLLSLVRKLNAQLKIVHVRKEGKDLTAEQNAGQSRLESIFNNLQHEYVILEATDFQEGILNYLQQEKTELLVVVAHHHGLLERIFGHHTSAELSEKSQTPLLILQDKA